MLPRFTPLALSAMISLSCDRRPKVMSTAISTAHGAERATMYPSDSRNSWVTTPTATPRFTTRSR